MNKNKLKHVFTSQFKSIRLLLSLILGLNMTGAYADGTAPCNAGSGINSTECGVNSTATGDFSTALGYLSEATAGNTTAVGSLAKATMISSTAIGSSADATNSSTAVGTNARARADQSTALGTSTWARSDGSTRIGHQSGNFESTDSSPFSIAIGNSGNVRPSSPGAIAIGGDSADADFFGADAGGQSSIAIGFEAMTSANGAIAIGGDLDGDGVGAFAGNVNAIAIGADVQAGAANTVTMGYPLFVKDQNTTTATRNLLRLSNKGPAGFRFEDNDSGDAWIFRQTLNGGFTMDALNTVGQQEARFSEGGNLNINGTLTEGSSRTSKKNIKTIDTETVLDQLKTLPIHQWTYKHETDQVKHLGPMAEDFYKAFKLGSTSKGISSLDSSGVALAAIQALNAKLDEKDVAMLELKDENTTLKLQFAEIKAQLDQLQALTRQFVNASVSDTKLIASAVESN